MSACHTLNADKKMTFDMPKIIVRLVNRKQKIKPLKNSKKLKGTCAHISEHLTHKSSQITHAACIPKKNKEEFTPHRQMIVH